MKQRILTSVACLLLGVQVYGQGTPITNFGTNPGNLDGYAYVPANVPNNAPLVVVMHGCSQNASDFSTQTAWNTLADEYKFYVVHVGQKSGNHSLTCFNYWEPNDHSRNQGECLSIKQMTDYMKSNYSIDPARVFATGLSAGGAMTMVMISAYPDVFAAGASMAGLPYKTATNSTEVYVSAGGFTNKTPQQWGDLVRAQYPGFTGSYPRLAVFHGNSDATININNATESVEQYTNLHNTDQTPDNVVNSFQGNSNITLRQYHNSAGQTVVEYYEINGMGHGIAVAPGQGCGQGGVTGSYSLNVGLYSSYWTARFFGIISDINTSVSQNGTTLTANLPGASYQWLDCSNNFTPVSGQAAQNQSFTPSVNGEYAVAVTLGQCTETSSCHNVTIVNNPPVIPDSTITIAQDSTVTVCLPVADVNGVGVGTHTVTGCGVTNGTVTNVVYDNGYACVTFTPAADYHGTAEICVSVCGTGSQVLCNTGTITINITPPTSAVRDNQLNRQADIYPNPNDGTFFVDLKDISHKTTIEIRDIQGRLIENKSAERNEKTVISLSEQKSGIYFVHILSENEKSVFKVVKK